MLKWKKVQFFVVYAIVIETDSRLNVSGADAMFTSK